MKLYHITRNSTTVLQHAEDAHNAVSVTAINRYAQFGDRQAYGFYYATESGKTLGEAFHVTNENGTLTIKAEPELNVEGLL